MYEIKKIINWDPLKNKLGHPDVKIFDQDNAFSQNHISSTF